MIEAGEVPVGGEVVRLTRIRIYPLKGAGGVELEEGSVGPFGLPGDRRWMLVRSDGEFISQRTHPRLALIRAEPAKADGEPVGDGGQGMSFTLRAPGMDALELSPTVEPAVPLSVRVQQDRVEGWPLDHATGWVSEYLREPCRLVFCPEGLSRPVDPSFAPGHRTSFTDGYPLLLTTEESLEDLNRRLAGPSSMLRFRPNLVVRGARPWEEDRWRVLEIGGVRIELVKPCARCSVTTVDPGTGTRGKEPLRTLGGFRGWGGKAYFGQNGVFARTGSFRVGQAVHILEEGDARPPLIGTLPGGDGR